MSNKNPAIDSTPAAAADSAPPAPARETLAQRDAKRQGERMKKTNADTKVQAIQSDLVAQSESVKAFKSSRRVARREFDTDGAPKSNPRTKARSAR